MIFSSEIIFANVIFNKATILSQAQSVGTRLIFQSTITPLEGKTDNLVNFFQLSANTKLCAAHWDWRHRQFSEHFHSALSTFWHVIILRQDVFWDTVSFTTQTLCIGMHWVGLVCCFQPQRHRQELYQDVGAMSFGPSCYRKSVHVCCSLGETCWRMFWVGDVYTTWSWHRPHAHIGSTRFPSGPIDEKLYH